MTPQPLASAGARSRPRWLALAALATVAIAACENPQAPASCGPIPGVTVNVGESTTVTACFNDANGDALAYSATSSNPTVATVAAAGSTVNITAVAPGNATITITANDPGGLQATSAVTVTVPNRAPQAVGTIAAVTVAGGETATVDVSGNFMEPDGQTLSYSASSSDTDVATATTSGSAITVTAVGRGMATVTVTATDPGGESATQSFQVTVPNRAPEPTGSIPDAEVKSGESTTVDLESYFTDPDGDNLSYAATSSAPTVATVSVAGRVLTVTGTGSGTATVTVTATDTGDETATQSFQVTVPNRAPEAVGTIPAQTATEGGTETVVLRSYFKDPDGDALTYTATSANPAVAVATVSGSVLTIRAVGAGFSVITITATDPGGLTATQIVTIQVSARNAAPEPVGTIPAQSLSAGESATVVLTSYFTDPDGDALTYTASSANPAVATATATGATLTITGRSPGSATVTVTARDPGGLTATQSVSVSVGTATSPDLLFSSVTPRAVTIAPGGSEVLVFTIKNAGNANSGPTSAQGYESSDATITTSDRVATNDVAIPGLVPNGEATIRLTLNVPANTPAGSSYIGMCVDPVTGESNTTNNCSASVRVTIASPQADLAVSDVRPDNVVVTAGGAGSSVVFTVTNDGAAESISARGHFYESDDDKISTNDMRVGASARIPALGAGSRHHESHTITSGKAPGSEYWYGMCVAVLSNEANTDNNCSPAVSVGVVQSGGADLVVTGADPVTVTIRAGQSQDVTFTIQNVGNAATTQFTSGEILKSTDNTITLTDVKEQVISPVPLLDPLGKQEVKYTVTGAGNPGDVYYIGVCLDNTGANGEAVGSQRMNNCSSAAAGAVVTVVITAASSQQSDVKKQQGEGVTEQPMSRVRPTSVAKPEQLERRALPPGSLKIVVTSVEVRNRGVR